MLEEASGTFDDSEYERYSEADEEASGVLDDSGWSSVEVVQGVEEAPAGIVT
jgi:hypothetical protein